MTKEQKIEPTDWSALASIPNFEKAPVEVIKAWLETHLPFLKKKEKIFIKNEEKNPRK